MSNILFHKYRLRFIKNILKWNFNFYFTKKTFPLIAAFRLTNRCNLTCQMCSIWRSPQKQVLDFQIFKKIVHDLGRMGCCYVSLSGGEPLLITNIADYVLEVKENNIFSNLVTNGLLINPKLATQFSKVGLDTISISIDGFEETHDRIRGKKGAFDIAIGAVDIMKRFAPEVKIVVNTVLAPWNIDELIEFCDFLERKSVFLKFQPIYRHPDSNNQEGLSKEWTVTEEFTSRSKEVINYLIKKKNVINSRYFLKAIPNYFSGQLSDRIFDRQCFTGRYYCEFKEDGRIFSCIEGMGWNNGLSIDNMNLSDFVKSDIYLKEIKKLETCKRCKQVLTICYAEPKFLLPLHNLIYARLKF